MTNKSGLYLSIVTVLVTLISGCGNSNPDSANKNSKDSAAIFDITAMQKIIDAKNKVFGKAFENGDSATVVNNYTKDAKLFPPNSDAVVSKDSIGLVVSEYLKYGIKEFRDETTALYGNETNLIEEGKFFMGDGKGNTIDKGKYLCVWRKEDGVWKIYSDIFNTSLPPAKSK